jgi:hypothetical protein
MINADDLTWDISTGGDFKPLVGYLYNADLTAVGRVDFAAPAMDCNMVLEFSNDGTFTLRDCGSEDV